MIVVKQNDIKHFPFQEASKLGPTDLAKWAEEEAHLTSHNSWMLPQIFAHFGSFKARKNDEGKYDTKALLADNIGSDPWSVGLLQVVTRLNRSALVKSQNTLGFTKYSALVPLILAGIKEHQGIRYSQWSEELLEYVLGSVLYEAARAPLPDYSKSRALELRVMGLTTKTGKSSGQVKKATSTWTLTGLQHTEWGGLPKLTLTMLAQIWVAHPSLRNASMILDPTDWDNVPEPLVSSEVVSMPVSTNKYSSNKQEEFRVVW